MATTHAIDATIDGVGDAADALLFVPCLVRVDDDGRADIGLDALLDNGREASRERD